LTYPFTEKDDRTRSKELELSQATGIVKTLGTIYKIKDKVTIYYISLAPDLPDSADPYGRELRVERLVAGRQLGGV
jgi:hypothetical protein